MIAILFLSYFLSLFLSFCSISDLTVTIVAYFVLSTDSADHEAERIVNLTRNAFLNVGKLQGVGYINFSSKSALVSDLGNLKADITYFYHSNFLWGLYRILLAIILHQRKSFLPIF